MNTVIKSSAITFGGYLYQNLIGLEFLCNWLDDPSIYQWVKFEADDDESPKGLDDIVALQAEGSMVLLQVKFTVDPYDDKNALTWDWLMQHKPHGRSLLQKWCGAFNSTQPTAIAEAALVTNRIPDRTFSESLDQNTRRVNLASVPPDIKEKLIQQLDGEETANEFLTTFEFRHSHQGYVAMERTLFDRYVPHYTRNHGWLALRVEAIDWAVRKVFPPPDGSITLELLRGILDSRRPEPLNQSFRIPDGYYPPDEDFAEDFLKEITAGQRRIHVLWGSPGQGKSTFLSYLCTELDKLAVPHIRHHYFLDLADTSNRLSFPEVANSLMAQMEAQHIEHLQGKTSVPGRLQDSENLRSWLEACAKGYALQGKRFLVIVDGLDHVWRENEGDRRPLESLFSAIFPLPDNLVLVLGTQRVDKEQLPSAFLRFVNTDDWIELPSMSLTAVKQWLEAQLNANRFELPERPSEFLSDPLTELSSKFHELSHGHPLHLIYSFENIAREARVLIPRLIDELPDCPDGNIRTYYRVLWQRLSFQAKDALHLVADIDFIWPNLGLEDCLGIPIGELNREIGHLFYSTEAGKVPFHGSILAFIREDPEHVGRVVTLLPRVITWLETKSPAFHTWGWLWLLKARAGQTDDLINKPNRNWVIDSLASAYPPEQIVAILSAAERAAHTSHQFARSVRIRLLKDRVNYGTQFQVDDYDRVSTCAIALADDDYPLRNLHARFRSASISGLYILANQFIALGRLDDACHCKEQIKRQINDRLRVGAYDNQFLKTMTAQYFRLAARTQDYDPAELVANLANFRRLSIELFRIFVRELSKHGDLNLLIAFLPYSMSQCMREDLELALIQLAGACQARLQDWPEFSQLRNNPIVSCWALLYAPTKATKTGFSPNVSSLDVRFPQEETKENTERYLHDLFFYVLSECLELRGANPVVRVNEFKERHGLNISVTHVIRLASSVGSMLARGETVPYSYCYQIMATEHPPKDHDHFAEYVTLRRALLSITTDLFLLTSLRTNLDKVSASEWRFAVSSRHFLFSEWLERYLEDGRKIIERQSIQEELERRLIAQIHRVSEFGNRAHEYLDLCELAVFYGLDDISRTLLSRVLACVMGYGWRKDMTIFSVLDGIDCISTADTDYTRCAISRICPAIAQIDVITDGDETRYAKFKMAEQLLGLMPNSYVAYYEHLLKTSEWYEAEEVFSRLLVSEPLSSPVMSFVTTGLWDSTSVGALRSRAQDGDPIAAEIVMKNAELFGCAPDDLGKDRYPGSSSMSDEHGLDVTIYSPDSLTAMLDELREKHVYAGERKAVREWFDHWISQNRGMDLLRSLEVYLDEENVPSALTELLDDVFQLSLAMEGKNKAYRWIVAAQIQRHGWDRYYSSEDVGARFKTFAQYYRDRWKEFILDTSVSPYKYGSREMVIGRERLVQFLMAVGESTIAIQVTEQMVEAVLEDVADQPLEVPVWLTGD